MMPFITPILFSIIFSSIGFAQNAPSKKSKLIEWGVPSVTCISCSYKIRKAIKDIPGVTDIKVDPETKKMRFTCDSCNEKEVKARVIDLGYPVES